MKDDHRHSKRLSAPNLLGQSNLTDSGPSRMELAPAPEGAPGPTLQELRKRLNGSDHGEFREPWHGTHHPVDLRQWAHLPSTTVFRLRFHYGPPPPTYERQSSLDTILLAALPRAAGSACTISDLLDRPVYTKSEGTVEDNSAASARESVLAAREVLGWVAGRPSITRIRSSLSRMAKDGRVLRRGRGTSKDPFRYWMDATLGVPPTLRPATDLEIQQGLEELRLP
jgi:hypothetical protein